MSAYVTQEKYNAQSTKKDSPKMRKEARDLVWSLLTRFLRKLIPRSFAICARNMGAHIPHTTHKIVVGMRRMEMRNPASKQPRKVQENPIPQSSLSHNYVRKCGESNQRTRHKKEEMSQLRIGNWVG
jgi:hypothetical protein